MPTKTRKNTLLVIEIKINYTIVLRIYLIIVIYISIYLYIYVFNRRKFGHHLAFITLFCFFLMK
jgi:hypothetical protein